MFNKIGWLSKKQMQALVLITPGPVGQGLTYEKAAKELGINESTLIKRINRFKNRFPDAWRNFESIRNVSRRQENNLRNLKSLNRGIDENRIVERF